MSNFEKFLEFRPLASRLSSRIVEFEKNGIAGGPLSKEDQENLEMALLAVHAAEFGEWEYLAARAERLEMHLVPEERSLIASIIRGNFRKPNHPFDRKALLEIYEIARFVGDLEGRGDQTKAAVDSAIKNFGVKERTIRKCLALCPGARKAAKEAASAVQ